MRMYSKFLVVGGAIAALAVPSAAMADPGNGNGHAYGQPNGTYVFKADGTNGNGNVVATDSSQIIQNGQFVSQQAQAGDRAAIVQGLVGH
jgi:hypothetical protein